jgi:hypothetical protein
MVSCAHVTRGRGLPSLGLMARLGVPVGGRVEKLRAVEDQSAPIPERERASLEGWERSRQTILRARRTRTMRQCSSDARTEGQSGDFFGSYVE